MKALIALALIFGAVAATSPLEIALMNLFSPLHFEPKEFDENLENGFADFFLGIVDGVKRAFRDDLQLFKLCIACPPKIWVIWLDFFDYIKNLTWETFSLDEFISEVMDFVMGSIGEAIPCIIIYMMADKFVQLILNPTWENLKFALIKTLAQNAQYFFNIIIDIFRCLFAFAWYGAGFDIGIIVYIMVIH